MRGFELVAGERRLRAARMAGLKEVPCIISDISEQTSSVVALVENLQRRDLDCFEEAEGIRRLIQLYGLSQDEAARRLGKSQSAVANKLRLLRLDKPTVETIRHHGLTERHARALLRVDDPTRRMHALEAILTNGMNVAQTDAYIDSLTDPSPITPPLPKKNKTLYIVKDVRLFLNSITHAVDVMRGAGIDANLEREDENSDITLTITIKNGKNVSRETMGKQFVEKLG
jgi:ParB family chromosome partitioning protein